MSNSGSSSPTLIGCTFTDNSAISGGGMCNISNSSPTLIGCTFTGNKASSNGGGGMNNGGNPTISHCIISGNTGGEVNEYSGSPTYRYSIVGTTFYNGSGGMTTIVQAVTGIINTNGTLPAGSFAIDRGNETAFNQVIPNEVKALVPGTDILGNPRVSGEEIDIGAYEYVHPAPYYPPVTTTPASYTVTFNTNGGGAVEAVTVKSGDKLTPPKDPEREGYRFTGWYTDKDCTEPYDFEQPEYTAFPRDACDDPCAP